MPPRAVALPTPPAIDSRWGSPALAVASRVAEGSSLRSWDRDKAVNKEIVAVDSACHSKAQNLLPCGKSGICNGCGDSAIAEVLGCEVWQWVLFGDRVACLIRRNGKVAVGNASLDLSKRSWTEEQRGLAVARCADERCALVGVYAALKAAEAF
jgi:hypothetical protein